MPHPEPTLRFEVMRLGAAALAAVLPGLRDTPLLPQGPLAIYTLMSLLALLLVSLLHDEAHRQREALHAWVREQR
jgi:hypothetical protein